MSLVVVDACGANMRSVLGALNRLGVHAEVSADVKTIQAAERIILPGVGAAGEAMDRLRLHKLESVIPALTQPVLGICVGMQVLFAGSDEDDVDCLGVFPERLKKFSASQSFPVPHMGWNRVRATGNHPLFASIDATDHCYFVHSYAAGVFASTIAETRYDQSFSAAVAQGNFMGVQFHPERSGTVGQKILENFLNLSAEVLTS